MEVSGLSFCRLSHFAGVLRPCEFKITPSTSQLLVEAFKALLEVTAVLITVLFLIISIIVSDFAVTIFTNMLDNLSID